MTFVPASAAALRRAALVAARSVLSRRARRGNTPGPAGCFLEALESGRLFNAYFVTIGPNPSGGPDDSGSLHIKPEYDSDGDGVTDNPVTARTGEDAIWQVVEGSWCHTVHHCGTATTYTYTFPADASTTQDRAFWLDVSDDPNTHAAHGAIGLQADWADPYRDPNILPDWNDAVWSVDADPVVLNTLTATNNKYTDQTATASDSSTAAFSVDPEYTDTSTTAALTLTGAVTPNKDSAYQVVLYQVLDPNGSNVASGTLSPSGSTVQEDWANFSPDAEFTIKAGVDQNGDGTLDAAEVTRTLVNNRKTRDLNYANRDLNQVGRVSTNRMHFKPGDKFNFDGITAQDSQHNPAAVQPGEWRTEVRVAGGGGGLTPAITVTMGGANLSHVWTPTISVPATGVFPGDYNVKIWINNENLPIFIYIHVD